MPTLRFSQLLSIACVALACATIGSALWPTVPLDGDIPNIGPIRALAHWDAGWYASIASNGYWYTPGQQSPVAFFPLFPLSIAGLTQLGANRWTAAELLSLVFGLAGVVVFTKWARLVRPERANAATWLLAIYPFSVYLYGIIYSDGLFLLCVSSAFFFLEKDRPWIATLLGCLATACRPVAIAVVAGLLVRALERRRARGERPLFVDFIPVFAVAGLVAWMAFLQWRFGDALAWVHVQSAPGWDQPPGWESWLKVSWFKTLFPRVAPLIAIRLGGHALVTVLALLLIIPTFKRLGWGYGVYCLIVVGIPAVSSKDFQGLGRYAIAAFPLFVTLADVLATKPWAMRAVIAASIVFFVFCAIAFGAGGYVA